MDPIANMFSQINNAQNARLEKIVIPFSKIKLAILTVIKDRGQIADFEVKEKKVFQDKTKTRNYSQIEVVLNKNKFFELKRVSRPGRRVYTSSFNIPDSRRTRKIVIISTSKGIFEGEEARKKGLGGEVIAEVK